MKKIAVAGLFVGCMALAFVAGTQYTSYTATKSVTNGMLAGVPAATFEGNPPDGEATLTGGYFWIVANAKSVSWRANPTVVRRCTVVHSSPRARCTTSCRL